MLAATGNRELIEKYVVPFIQDREAQYHRMLAGDRAATRIGLGDGAVRGHGRSTDLAGHVIARRDGDSYVISGQKSAWVSNGTIATHGLVILIADSSRGSRCWAEALRSCRLTCPAYPRASRSTSSASARSNQGEIFFDDGQDSEQLHADRARQAGAVAAANGRGGGPNAMVGAVFTGVARAAFEIAIDYSQAAHPGWQADLPSISSCKSSCSKCSPRSRRAGCSRARR